MENFIERARKIVTEFGELVEILMAIAVSVAIIFAMIGLLPKFHELFLHREDAEAFSEMLSAILSVIVGTEFLKMLAKPSVENVTEVLIFLISRHMIVRESSALENLLMVLSIAVLFVLEYLMIKGKTRKMLFGQFREKIEKRIDHELDIDNK